VQAMQDPPITSPPRGQSETPAGHSPQGGNFPPGGHPPPGGRQGHSPPGVHPTAARSQQQTSPGTARISPGSPDINASHHIHFGSFGGQLPSPPQMPADASLAGPVQGYLAYKKTPPRRTLP